MCVCACVCVCVCPLLPPLCPFFVLGCDRSLSGRRIFSLFAPLQLRFGSSCTFPVRSVVGEWRSGLGRIQVMWEKVNRDVNYLWLTDKWVLRKQDEKFKHPYSNAQPHVETLSTHDITFAVRGILCGFCVLTWSGGQVSPMCPGIYAAVSRRNTLFSNIHNWSCAFGRSELIKMYLFQCMSHWVG